MSLRDWRPVAVYWGNILLSYFQHEWLVDRRAIRAQLPAT